MSVNVAQVEQLNKKAQQMNATRQQMLGKKEAARAAYDKAVYAYQQKYGVQLDDTNLQAEYNSVTEKMATDFNELNALVLGVENGDYKNAVVIPQAITPQAPPTPPAPPTQQFAQPPYAPPTIDPSPYVQPVIEQAPEIPLQQGFPTKQVNPFEQTTPPVQTAPAQPFGGNPFGQQPQVQQQVDPSLVFVAGQPTNPLTAEDLDPSEQAFAPEGWGTPQVNIEDNFQQILNSPNAGTAFGQ